MNILLIRPRPDKETIGLQHVMICEPLELEYIAANIHRQDVKVEIVDMILEKESVEYFLERHSPAVVAMSGYITHVQIIKDYAKRIKKHNPYCKVVVGGVHAEVVPEDFISEYIDFIVEANPLKTFNRILLDLENEEIEGVYQKGKKSQKEGDFSYHLPDREKVARYRHRYYYMFHNPCALIKTSFGCPYHCSFCFCKEITNGKYFVRTVESVIEELKGMKEEEIYIVDDDFLFSRERILEFCRQLKMHQIQKQFLVYGRADFICHNEDVVAIFRKHGLRAVIVGLESYKNEDLNRYNKRTSLQENERAVEILKKYDIEIYATIILDMGFSKEDFQQLYGWLKKLGIIFVNLQPLTPLKGTEIFEQYEKDLIISREEYEKWDLAHLVLQPQKMSPRRFYFEMIKLYYKLTLEPKNVIKLIKKYGFLKVWKLSLGSSAVTLQYLQKIGRGK